MGDKGGSGQGAYERRVLLKTTDGTSAAALMSLNVSERNRQKGALGTDRMDLIGLIPMK